MSFPTTPTFHHTSVGWDATTRSHPAMKFMEDYTTNDIDGRTFMTDGKDLSTIVTPNNVLVASSGETFTGAKESWAALKKIYGPFVKHYHEPRELLCCELDKAKGDGWLMIGKANVYVVVPGEPGKGEQKVKSGDGREWDAVMPSAFRFEYVKSKEGGVLLQRSEIFSDPMPALTLMLKRGVVKVEDLAQ